MSPKQQTDWFTHIWIRMGWLYGTFYHYLGKKKRLAMQGAYILLMRFYIICKRK